MPEKQHIGIRQMGSLGPWGTNEEMSNLLGPKAYITHQQIDGDTFPVAALPKKLDEDIDNLKQSHNAYKQLDRSVLLSILASRKAIKKNEFPPGTKVGINIGSSRGATATFEKHYHDYMNTGKGKASPYASPTTTLGNLSSWVMADLALNGPVLSHSITCSTAIQALGNGMAWLKSGMADLFLAGGSEAPLTPFTLAQMQALKIYSTDSDADYPSRPLANNPRNGMILGEGAASFLLEPLSRQNFAGEKTNILLEAVGFGNEPLQGFTGISLEGTCFKRAMEMALEDADTGFDVDLILMHAPGTVKGDQAEAKAVRDVFGSNLPMLYSNKWQIGHTFGASAALSLVQALSILNTQQIPEFPYPIKNNTCQTPVRKIMINAAGFGGNAGSVIVSKPF